MRCVALALLAGGIALVPVVSGAVEASALVPISEGARSATTWTLHIEGLRIPPGSGGIVEVYAGRANSAAETGAERADYVGYVAPVPRNSREAERGVVVKGTLLDLTAKLSALRSEKQIRITLVQASPEPSKGGEDRKLAWDRIYITFK